MQTIENLKKIDELTMKALKVTEINHFIVKTDKGNLYLQLRKDDKEHKFVLDAVPVDTGVNKDLFKLFNGVLFNI